MKFGVTIASTALLAATCLTPSESHAGGNGAGVGLAVGLGILGGIIANAQQQQYYQQQQQRYQQQMWLQHQYYRQQQVVVAWSQMDPRILDCIRATYHFDPVQSGNAPTDPQMSQHMFYCNYLLRQPAPSVGGDPIPFNSRPPQTSVANQRQQDVVPISRSGRNFTVNATVNGAMTLPFLVDSGAEVVAVPINIFRGLQQRGAIQESDIIDVGYMGNADGSSRKTIKFFIRELQVGRHIAHNVQALLLPAGSDLLLGQTFLERFTWTLDARNQQLIITD